VVKQQGKLQMSRNAIMSPISEKQTQYSLPKQIKAIEADPKSNFNDILLRNYEKPLVGGNSNNSAAK
jgi:hypothetical protein